MQSLAKAIVDMAAFIEISDDSTVDPDAAVEALESLSVTLSNANPLEISAIKAAISERLAFAKSPAEKEFFRGFLSNLGLTDKS
jgi:hypothetical protein